jgi:hypothetical protein
VQPFDSRALVHGARSLEHSAIDIERHHPGHAGGSEYRCQNAVTAPDDKDA